MLVCWLELNNHPEDPATGQLGRFVLVFFGIVANTELVLQFMLQLHAFHAAIPMQISKLYPPSPLLQ
jgi:hypothetical protein